MPSCRAGLGASLGDTAEGWSQGRHKRAKRGPGVSTKTEEVTQALQPGKTEALRTDEGRTDIGSLTWHMAFPVSKSPAHSISSYTK